MPRKKAGPAFTVEFPKALPVERHGEHWWAEIDGKELRLSNLDKVFWPDEGYTKGDLIAYYYNIAPRVLPYLKDRPLTMKRLPNGAFGNFFYEKEAPPTTPDWMPICNVESAGADGRWGPAKNDRINYLMVDDTAGLLFVANLGCIEFHPLHSRCGSIETPDYLFFDLDPFEPATFQDVLTVAGMVKVACDRLGLKSYPKTSGATGMQVYVPLEPGYTYDQVRDFVGKVGGLIWKVDPARVTMEWEIKRRTGKVFIDHNMNRVGANIAAVYSVRPEPGASISMPLTWSQVDQGNVRPHDFTIATVWKQLKRTDPFRGVVHAPQSLGDALSAVDVPVEDEMPPTDSYRIKGEAGRDWVPRDVAEGKVRRIPAQTRPPRPEKARKQSGPSKSDDAIARSKDPKLRQYLKMRDLEATPEPAGGTSSPTGNSFVIQRHDATRLHYDLRLERDGVLVSWAVPKGLPFQKGERHLAVQTEDHPMEYGSFQGKIPEGHYGAGDVKIWDRGTYDLLEWTDRKVSFRLHGDRHRGEYHLVKTRGERDWLVLLSKESPNYGPAKPPMLTPMLATGGYKPFDGKDWWFEPKLDGVRTLLYLDGEDVRLISRTGKDHTKTYPELARVFRNIAATNAVVDGEIVATDEAGRTSFELLQQRMNLTSSSEIERIRKRIPVEMVAFDLLWVDGDDLTTKPLRERREMLTARIHEGRGLRLMYTVPEEGERFYQIAREHGLEGIIGKRVDSRYVPGKRSEEWRKVKILKTQDAVIVGSTRGQGGRERSFGALLLGAYRNGKLIWIGQVGTGFTERTINDLLAQMKDLEVAKSPISDRDLAKVKGARWVKPELVCEVEYLQMTGQGKLRAPSFKGLRPDKLPEDCILEPEPELETAAS
ncbi:MAG: non-homologous end-joining DNA ligase [Actinomycetota bacterium]|nr:non-homologous end-joining DNA ligase [Actinomycetota bacterium]